MAMGTKMTMPFRMMSMSPGMPSSSPPTQSPAPASLPLRTIPGSYGWPLLGPVSDRLDYFWFQGPDTFFKKRIEKHKSTVFRTNVPPTFPFFAGVNPNVVAVLDTKSFAYLFDMDIVEKKNILLGEFMPSVKFTGNIRTCAYLDTSEPQHTQIFYKRKRVQVIHLKVVRLQHCRPAEIPKSSCVPCTHCRPALLLCPICAELLSLSSSGNSLVVYSKYEVKK